MSERRVNQGKLCRPVFQKIKSAANGADIWGNAVYEIREAFQMEFPQADVCNHSLIKLITSFKVASEI